MSGIFGALNISTNDRSYINTIGQRIVWDAVQMVLTQYNADLMAAKSIFVGGTTQDHKFRFKLPGGGRLQRRGGQAQSAAVRAVGSWDVAFPLEDFGAGLAADDIALAYMTMQELNRHLDTVMIQDMNTVRFEILKAVFNNTPRNFNDFTWGNLTVQPLASGDAVTYPPVLGSETETSENHYLETGYAASSISDTNNPFPMVRDELEEHFGAQTGGENIVAFINNAQTGKVQALTDFDEVPDRFVRQGNDTNIPMGLPTVPGRILGRVNGVWVVEWRWIPASYLFAQHLEAPAPLMERTDPADTGLGTGLQLISRDEKSPFEQSQYRHRFGYGVANRLNGLVVEFGIGGSYTIPEQYA